MPVHTTSAIATSPLPPRHHPRPAPPTCSDDLLSRLEGRIAIVGNATPRREFGPLIDAHDVVIRMNNYQVEGYERLVGSRTDYRCTTGFRDIEHRGGVPEFSPFRADAPESANLASFNRANPVDVIAARTDVHLRLQEKQRGKLLGKAIKDFYRQTGRDKRR